jgi:hypothetical protein
MLSRQLSRTPRRSPDIQGGARRSYVSAQQQRSPLRAAGLRLRLRSPQGEDMMKRIGWIGWLLGVVNLARIGDKSRPMSVAEPADRSPYRGYRFPSEIIAHAVWLYFRFHLSFRDIQDLLAERGIIVSH